MSTDTYENVRRAIAHHDFSTHAGYLAAMRLLADYDTTRDASWAEYCENAATVEVISDVIASDAMATTRTSEQRAVADAREDAAAIFALMVTT